MIRLRNCASLRYVTYGETRIAIFPLVGEKRSGVNALSGHSGSILKFPPECSLLRGFAAPLQLSGERERPMLSALCSAIKQGLSLVPRGHTLDGYPNLGLCLDWIWSRLCRTKIVLTERRGLVLAAQFRRS